MNTIILTVHNKQNTISHILEGILKYSSNQTIELIVIADGCTDNSLQEIEQFLKNNSPTLKVQIVLTEDIWETRANNVGLKIANTEFVTIIQDDMLILDHNWDQKLLNVFKRYDVFGVSGRACHNFSLKDGIFSPIDLYGREFPFGSQSLFGRICARLMAKYRFHLLYKYFSPIGFALTVNRGPLMMRRELLQKLDFLDEAFAPFELDDVDLCCRAYKKFNLRSASCPIYYKELSGSKATNAHSQTISRSSIEKNTKLLLERHLDLSGSR
jgi:glycosyltransferase involved in cell wall biosynthesis